MVLPKIRDPRFILIRRGGSLLDEDHRLLALWAADCAEHVLGLFEASHPGDRRPRLAVDAARAWARGEIRVTEAKVAAYHANEAGRGLPDPEKYAAYAAGQAGVVAHVAAHELGAAAYAIRATRAAAGIDGVEAARLRERDWQRERLPERIAALVLDDQRLRNDLCWSVFSD